MPRFNSQKDVEFFRHISKELVDEVMEVLVVMYKLSVSETPVNLYGESMKKKYYIGVQIPCIIDREQKRPDSDGAIIDYKQTSTFAFLRDTLQEKSIYPEAGDIIDWDGTYWEIDNVSENQLIGSQTYYNWSIVCISHMTSRTTLQIEQRQFPSNQSVGARNVPE